MIVFRRSIEVAAEPDALFDLTQDYPHRLDWDPFLKEARLLGGADRPGIGVRAWCVARNGLGMETDYVSFNPPGACAVAMTKGPWFFRSFAGSWRFEEMGPGRTRVTFTYGLAGRPFLISWMLRLVFARETRRRLEALRRYVEARVDPGRPPGRREARGFGEKVYEIALVRVVTG
jgi:ribosome-associated toxin RatA of RatAB toxin-antitoxin module